LTGLSAQKIATGVGRTEGPSIRADGEIVVVSMNRGCLLKIKDGETSVLADVGHKPNGTAEWSDGSIYVAQSGGKRFGPDAGTGGVQVVTRDGVVSWLTRDPISPNDLCFGPDGFLYVTDPLWPRMDDGRLFRCNIETGESELHSVPWFPNGIAFGLDDALYVARYREQQIMRYSIDGGKFSAEEMFVQMAFGHPDGLVFDVDGNLIVCANSQIDGRAGEIHTYDPRGVLVDVFLPGQNRNYTNAALDAGRRLVITDTDGDAVLGVEEWPRPGLPLYPFRALN
jgi:gluconolactonase